VTSPPRPPYPLYHRLVSLGLLLPIMAMLALVIMAQIDVALMEQYDVRRFGVQLNDATVDYATQINSAITLAQARGNGNSGYAPIYFPAGDIHIASTITQKSSPFVCAGAVVGTRLLWNGAADDIAVERDGTVPGGNSWGGMERCTWRPGTGAPLTWLSITSGNPMDVGYRLRENSFNTSHGPAIVLATGYWNFYADGNRFDACGTYCYDITLHDGAFLQTLTIHDRTYDNNDQGALAAPGGLGYIHINNDTFDTATNAGTFVLEGIRIETNVDWAGDGDDTFCVVRVTPSSTTGSPGVRMVTFRDVTYQDAGTNNAGDYLLCSAPASLVGYTLDNVIVTAMTGLASGATNCDANTYTASPWQGRIGYNKCGSDFFEVAYGAMNVRAPAGPASTSTGFQLFKDAETSPRVHLDRDGQFSLGSGSGTPDTFLVRVAANVFGLGTDDMLEFRETTTCASTTPASNRVRLCSQDNGAGKTEICAKFATGSLVCFATEP
jgi:hypothetical protein